MWPNESVHREDFLRRLLLATAHVRTKVNALLQLGRLRVVRNGASADNQNPFRKAGERREIGLYSLR